MNPKILPRIAGKMTDAECNPGREENDLVDDVRQFLRGLYLDYEDDDEDEE